MNPSPHFLSTNDDNKKILNSTYICLAAMNKFKPMRNLEECVLLSQGSLGNLKITNIFIEEA